MPGAGLHRRQARSSQSSTGGTEPTMRLFSQVESTRNVPRCGGTGASARPEREEETEPHALLPQAGLQSPVRPTRGWGRRTEPYRRDSGGQRGAEWHAWDAGRSPPSGVRCISPSMLFSRVLIFCILVINSLSFRGPQHPPDCW